MKFAAEYRFFFVFLLLVCLFSGAAAQPAGSDETRARALQMMKDLRYTDALPLLEKLATDLPRDPVVQLNLGFALLGQAKHTEDPTAARSMRARARASFVKAKELGDDSQLVIGMIDGIPVDGGVDVGFSANAKANKFMEDGEKAFSSGRPDDALAAYKKALEIDPMLYHAALFAGDVFVQTGKFADAEVWYQKAIAIDPMVETAYRYSATPLMKQQKYDQARARYIEAFITEPYNRLAISGIVQWAEATGSRLGHPEIGVPEIKTGPDGKPQTTINVGPDLDDGSLAWGAYVATREAWRSAKFVKAYPSESAYRHSLKEEAEALRSVVEAAKASKSKSLNPQIKILADMNADGVLEAYILMARPDKGIARDHREYLRANRDKMRLYVTKYVISGK
jgi:tetratricopeptide (TPR) repeat protein